MFCEHLGVIHAPTQVNLITHNSPDITLRFWSQIEREHPFEFREEENRTILHPFRNLGPPFIPPARPPDNFAPQKNEREGEGERHSESRTMDFHGRITHAAKNDGRFLASRRQHILEKVC